MDANINDKAKVLFPNIKGIFKKSQTDNGIVQEQQVQNNLENKQEEETYVQYGTRVCAMVTASPHSLAPHLQKVYNHIYRSQCEDQELQDKAKKEIQTEIDAKKAIIEKTKIDINKSENNISDKQRDKEDLEREKIDIKSRKEQVNKEQRLKLIIGLIIIIPLTFYLFLFYSSTFYSAFFGDASSSGDLMGKLFDGRALVKAMEDGLMEFFFVLCGPIIFLALGFCLHFFSVEKGVTKWFKMVGLVFVTLAFDCILAYKIGEQMHTVGIIVGQYPVGEVYTIDMAVHDINSWAVIFCGFIVYIIWGLVFAMCMRAYNNMDLNQTNLKSIEQKIEDIKNLIAIEKSNIVKLKQEIVDNETIIQKLEKKMTDRIFFDKNAIKAEMTNFFAGWVNMMKILNKSVDDLNTANTIYEAELKNLFNNNNMSNIKAL